MGLNKRYSLHWKIGGFQTIPHFHLSKHRYFTSRPLKNQTLLQSIFPPRKKCYSNFPKWKGISGSFINGRMPLHKKGSKICLLNREKKFTMSFVNNILISCSAFPNIFWLRFLDSRLNI